MRERTRSILESVVITAIILVLIQTFLEDFGVLVGWVWTTRRVLVITGFAFDLFFTIEFLARLYTAVFNGRGGTYFTQERGWIDFLASVPLLLLSSGPGLLSLITGGSFALAFGGMLNVLKVIKAIRIARVLRLLRVLKIFKQIKYTDSVMAQRHIAKITSLVVSIFVFTLFLLTVGSSLIGLPDADRAYSEKNIQEAEILAMSAGVGQEITGSAIADYTERDPDLLLIKSNGQTIFSRYDNDFYERNFGPSDYQYVEVGSHQFFFDLRELLALQSKEGIIYFIVIVVMVIFVLLYYSPHFAITVTDPILVMKKGMDDPGYNLEVKVSGKFQKDDVYQLAESYNRVFLPMKDRSRDSEEASSSVLDISDFKDILTEE